MLFRSMGLDEAARLPGTLISTELFSILGVRPALGRVFESGEDVAGQDRSVILSDALWRQRFGRDPHVIGRSIELDGVRREIIGVMQKDFRFPSATTQLWNSSPHETCTSLVRRPGSPTATRSRRCFSVRSSR